MRPAPKEDNCLLLVVNTCTDQAEKQGMRLVGTALELRVILHTDKVGVIPVLDGLNKPAIW